MYATVVQVTARPGSWAKSHESYLQTLAPLQRTQAGFIRAFGVRIGEDAVLNVSLWESKADANKAHAVLDPKARETQGELIADMTRYAGEVVAEVTP
jgi:hypothetical protein